MHLHSVARFRDGALVLSKQAIKDIESDAPISSRPANAHKHGQKRSYEQIKETRETNPEFMTGKRFRKKKGNVAKKFRGAKKRSKKQ